MAVLDQPGSENPRRYDLSFMYTKRCDLLCPFCMYSSGPQVTGELDLQRLADWLRTVDPSLIASFGVYGGEPGVDLHGFGSCLMRAKLIVGDRPCFVITNGTWSTDPARTEEFIRWCTGHKLFVVVSGTPFHRKHQNRGVLEGLAQQYPSAIRLKPEEENFHAMGRLEGKMAFSCTKKCFGWQRAHRIAVQPDGSILFQNCDGIYPIVGNIDEPFDVIDARIQVMRTQGFADVCPHFTPGNWIKPERLTQISGIAPQ